MLYILISWNLEFILARVKNFIKLPCYAISKCVLWKVPSYSHNCEIKYSTLNNLLLNCIAKLVCLCLFFKLWAFLTYSLFQWLIFICGRLHKINFSAHNVQFSLQYATYVVKQSLAFRPIGMYEKFTFNIIYFIFIPTSLQLTLSKSHNNCDISSI